MIFKVMQINKNMGRFANNNIIKINNYYKNAPPKIFTKPTLYLFTTFTGMITHIIFGI